jgi:hypothetical protein
MDVEDKPTKYNLFKEEYLEPPERDFAGRKRWFDLDSLAPALTEDGKTWLAAVPDTVVVPNKAFTYLGDSAPSLRRRTYEYLATAHSDDGDLDGIFGVKHDVEDIEEIMDVAMSWFGSTFVLFWDPKTGEQVRELAMG